MAAQNRNLTAARKAKNDEFYTQLADIERELAHYKRHFADKTVLCNCDDPRISNFLQFFFSQFNDYRLKRLIATCHRPQKTDLFGAAQDRPAVMLEYTGDPNMKTLQDLPRRKLLGDGDFRSAECVEFLRQADLVVTNPPFSLFREFIAQLVKFDKKFLIIGNFNAINYKEVFPLMRANKIWTGVSPRSMNFTRPDHRLTSVNACWFTNLAHAKRNEELPLHKKYDANEHPKYDNYDAINIDKVRDIPKDYAGAMGAPITFFDKYNPAQFEILGKLQSPRVNGRVKYARVLIKHKQIKA